MTYIYIYILVPVRILDPVLGNIRRAPSPRLLFGGTRPCNVKRKRWAGLHLSAVRRQWYIYNNIGARLHTWWWTGDCKQGCKVSYRVRSVSVAWGANGRAARVNYIYNWVRSHCPLLSSICPSTAPSPSLPLLVPGLVCSEIYMPRWEVLYNYV